MRTPIPFLGPEIYEYITGPIVPGDVAGWNSHHPIFAELIAEVKPQVIIEVGTWKGASAIHMANLSAEYGTKIYCVDTWIGGGEHVFCDVENSQSVRRSANGWPSVYNQFLQNVRDSGHAQRIVPVPFMSRNAYSLFAAHGVKAELIYIDGGHDYIDVSLDLAYYMPLLQPGGVIFGDDYNYPSVKHAVDEFFGGMQSKYSLAVAGEKWAIKPIQP